MSQNGLELVAGGMFVAVVVVVAGGLLLLVAGSLLACPLAAPLARLQPQQTTESRPVGLDSKIK